MRAWEDFLNGHWPILVLQQLLELISLISSSFRYKNQFVLGEADLTTTLSWQSINVRWLFTYPFAVDMGELHRLQLSFIFWSKVYLQQQHMKYTAYFLQERRSRTLAWIGIAWKNGEPRLGCPIPRVSDLVGLGWVLRVCLTTVQEMLMQLVRGQTLSTIALGYLINMPVWRDPDLGPFSPHLLDFETPRV